MEKHKRGYPTTFQKARLSLLLQADETLRVGKFSNTFNKKEAELRWINIANEINAIPGAVKTWSEWRKTWQDMKSKTKKRQALLRRSNNLTGGGPPPCPLTEEENIILGMISESALVGHTDSQESAVIFKDIPDLKPILAPPPAPAASVACIEEELPSISWSSQQIMPANVHHDNLTQIHNYALLPEESGTQNKTQMAPITIEDGDVIEVAIPANKGANAKGANFIENKPPTSSKKEKKTMAQKRLQKSIDTAAALNNNLKEKTIVKKVFYENYIVEMRKQTDAFLKIANSMETIANNFR